MHEKSHAFHNKLYHLNEAIIPQKLPCLLEVVCSGNWRKACIIGVVQKLCNRWRLKANVSKCAVVVFSYSKVTDSWTQGEHTIPQASNDCYL